MLRQSDGPLPTANDSGPAARRRASARRARPPLSRSDADRPERRIGAHRTAIAACSEQVVRTFARELDHLGHQLSLTHSRLTDPNLARYIATADLLAAHRSYDAAKAFLDHLTQVRPTGAAEKALIGALARSPNVALVDGLLEIVEKRPDPKATSIAVEVLGWRREQAATELLNGVVSAPLGVALQKAAIVALGRIGQMSAIPALLQALDTPELGSQASIALLLLGNWDGIDYQAQALAINDPNLGSSAGELVGRYGGPSYLLLLYRTAQSEGPAGYGALHGLGYLGDPRAIPHLLEATTSRDPTRRKVASTAIELITGRHEDPEEAMLAHRWNEWWHHNEGNFVQGTRYRHGEPLHAGLLVNRLGHDEALVRLACYDELVITTGVGLPFDAEGPYRVQLTHRNAWARWWRENRTEQPVGRWTFHGEPIG
ncbi:MAG: HEAT repeat domain-containing protein [Myxococcota bacterium]|nr:HEAT repeat domain-containing protein [Myxococcota bacterium]